MSPRTHHIPQGPAQSSQKRPYAFCLSLTAATLSLGGLLAFAPLLGSRPLVTTGVISMTSAHAAISARTTAQGEPETTTEQEGIRECVITLRSGRTITGELVREDARIVVIGIEGIETTFQRRNVANVVVLAPVAERYAKLRATIEESDIDGRLALVEWLRARKAYQLAIKELDSILLIDPLNPHAKLLHTWLSEYDKLSDRRVADVEDDTGDASSDAPKPDEPQRVYKIQRNELPLLDEADINLMRVYEIDLRNPPRLRVPDDVIQELIRMNPDAFSPNEDERAEVFNLPEIEKLKLLFTLKARSLYPRVEVLENPDSLQSFKDDVHQGAGWLINACASTRCHGGVDAGAFRLINKRPNTDETAFTNLYIIENTTISSGQPLIDYSTPERSPLLQMGMIKSNALIPHPEIPRDYPGTGFRPIFRNTRDRKYQQAVDWIRSMYQPRPEYAFDYPPPADQTQPETDQTGP